MGKWATSTKFLESGDHSKGDRTLIATAGEHKEEKKKKTKAFNVIFDVETGKYKTIELE